MDLKEVGCEGVYWMELAQDRERWLAHVMDLRVPQNAGNLLSS